MYNGSTDWRISPEVRGKMAYLSLYERKACFYTFFSNFALMKIQFCSILNTILKISCKVRR